jgi:serine-type D-Ala-D-Ala carboxypeptidase/endopeptidase
VVGHGRARDREQEPPSGTTIFEIGSITKVFTALLLADLALEGLVALEAPLDTCLPAGSPAPPWTQRITLADLSSHAARLPGNPPGTLGKMVRRPLHPFHALLDVYEALRPDDLLLSLGEMKARKSGSKAHYSNVGAGLLGTVLADRAGCSYEEAVRARVCLPLAMHDTVVELPDASRGRLADGHTRRGKRQMRRFAAPAFLGAGSLCSTADDMLRFLGANLEPPDTRLGSAIELAHRPRARLGRRVAVGLGWLLAPLRRHGSAQMLWHNGGTAGFRSFAGLVREAGTAVVVLGNANRSVDLLGLRILSEITPEDAD